MRNILKNSQINNAIGDNANEIHINPKYFWFLLKTIKKELEHEVSQKISLFYKQLNFMPTNPWKIIKRYRKIPIDTVRNYN